MCVGPEALVALGMSKATAATAATVASVAMGGMTAMSTIGSIQQGKAQQQMANYNAQIAENQAIAARQKAEFDLEAHKRQAARLKGSQRAQIAQSGGEMLDAGDVLGMTAEEAELDALAIKYGGRLAQDAARQKGTLARMEGAAAKQKAYAQAGATLLSGAKSGIALV